MSKFFEQGGPKFFVSVTTSRTRESQSYEDTTCELAQDWDDVIKILSNLPDLPRTRPDHIEIFTRPRLCRKCVKHAAQPEMFDEARSLTECLCWIEKTPCGVHKYRGG